MQLRYDTAPINKIEVDPDSGFLNAKDVPIARVGVFPYRKSDGSIDMEAKLPQYLLSDGTVESANGKPITDEHPPVMLNKDNVKEYMQGFTATNAHVRGDTLRVDLIICDSSLINDINNGKEELSIGFRTELQPVSGEFNGTKYDSVQSNIQINHVAVVDKGRAGHSIRLTGDSASMIVRNDSADNGSQSNSEDNKNMKTKQVILDGNTITIAEEDADTVAKTNQKITSQASDIAKWQAQIKELEEKIAKAKEQEGSKSSDEESSKEIEKLKKKADALEKQNKEMDSKLDSLVEDRVSLIDSAGKYLDSKYDFKGKSARQIKVDAIKTVKKDFDDTGVEDEKVDGIFTALSWGPAGNRKVTGYPGSGNNEETYGADAEDNAYDSIFDDGSNGGNK